MAPLTPASAAALARLRAYASPSSIYNSMPLSRRAAVLLLLFADKHGNLRVLLTLRASGMSSYSGQVALPGGKADTLSETAFDTARREAWEEVGLPSENSKMPAPFRVEHLCELPAQLSATEQVVRPCVAFLHTDSSSSSSSSGKTGIGPGLETKEESPMMIPKLNVAEVAAVFSAPLHRFLSSRVEGNAKESLIRHESKWQTWNGGRWLMHNFFVPKGSVRDDDDDDDSSSSSSSGRRNEQLPQQVEKDGEEYYKVWGMTARILIDSARIAYDEDPEFEHTKEFGEEAMVQCLIRRGRLTGERQIGAKMPRGQVEKETGAAVSKALDDNGGRGTKL